MRTIALALLAAVFTASASTLTQYASVTVSPDSMGFDTGRRTAVWTGDLDGGSWGIRLTEKYIDADSGGLVPRRYLGRNSLLLDARATLGGVRIGPGIRWDTGSTDALDFVLPLAAGTAFENGYTRPSLEIGAGLPLGFDVRACGSMVERSLEMADGTALGWSGQGAEGEVRWTSPSGLFVSTGGAFRSHTSDDIAFDTDWSSIDAAVGTAPVTLPALVQAMGEVRYTSFSGQDYLGQNLGGRLTCRVRAVRMLRPGLVLNMSVLSASDRRDGEWYQAASSGAARLVLTRGRPGSIPSTLALGGQYTVSSIRTARFEASARVHLVEGLSALLSADLREGPTTIPGAGPARQRVVLGSGLEYRFSSIAVAWLRFEDERTELDDIEHWSRVEAGLSLWPPALEI